MKVLTQLKPHGFIRNKNILDQENNNSEKVVLAKIDKNVDNKKINKIN